MYQLFFVFLVASLLGVCTQVVVASDLTNGSALGCIAPAEFEKCIGKGGRLDISACRAAEASPKERTQCLFELFTTGLNCFQSNCWNRVYGCDYTNIVSHIIFLSPELIDINTIPFFPAPDNAPGGCNCHNGPGLKTLWELLYDPRPTCLTEEPIQDGIGYQRTQTCNCCLRSYRYSTYLNACPNIDMPLLRFNSTDGGINHIEAVEWAKCAPRLQEYDCVKDMGYKPYPSGQSLYQPSNLPTPGTETLTTTSGQVTAPVSGWTYTWSAKSKSFVITAFSPTGTVISIPTSIGSNEGGAAGQAATTAGGQSGTGAPSPSPTSGGERNVVGSMYAVILPFLLQALR